MEAKQIKADNRTYHYVEQITLSNEFTFEQQLLGYNLAPCFFSKR